jgi:hypothetical protein
MEGINRLSSYKCEAVGLQKAINLKKIKSK